MPPIVQSRATKVVVQTDFANVVGSPTGGYAEVEVTMSADGVLRFYSSGGSGGELTDGDKGDITVSSSGATWTIDDAAVTYAKIQNVTDARLLGRSAGSAGAPQEITVGSGLKLVSGDLATFGLLTDSAFEASDTMKLVGRYTASGGPLEELSIGSGLNVSGAGTISVAQVDHGSLSGLADDDHSQYHNDTRGDARYYTKAQVYTQSEVDAIVAALATPTYRVTFYCNNATSLTLTNSPVAARFIGNSSGHVQLADLSTYSQVRLQCRVATAGTASSKIKLMYATSSPTVQGSYSNIGSAGAVSASMASTTIADSGWLDLASGAIADDVYLSIFELDGDGAADPALRTIIAEFR